MKLDKKKKVQLLIAGGILALLLIIIFSLNSTSTPKASPTTSDKLESKQKQSKPLKQITIPEPKPETQKNSKSSLVAQQQKVLDQELQNLIASYKNLEKNVKSQPQQTISQSVKPYTPPPRRTPTPTVSLSPLDRQASQSAVFFPGGAPKPVNTSGNNYSRESKNSTSSNDSNASADQNGESKDDMDSNNPDSSDNNDLSTLGNNYGNSFIGGGGGFIPAPTPTQATMTLQYSPSDDYDFVYAEDVAGPNPLDEISNSLTLTITVNNPTDSFTTISFCNSQYASCLGQLELSDSSLTISTSNVTQIKPTITSNSYISTSITIDDTSTNYMVPRLYFLLSTSDNSTQVQANASFPVRTDCTTNEAGNIATCTVTNSSTTTMNITVNGTTKSGS